ncbi:MAG: hypothetical protein GY851_33975 [bacterium]|nr:hypothetical protein [bacterium]
MIVAAFEPFREAATLPSGISTSDDGLPRDWRERLSFLPEDEYVAAITEAGKRCSNVSGFAVQRDAKTEDRGVLEIVALEPPPYREVPLLGMRVTGSSTLQETFDATAAHYANLTVDGIPRNWTVRVWGGLAPELGVGDRWVMVVDPGGFLLPSIEPGKPHRLKAQVGEYLAEPIDFNPGSPHGEAWDEATRAMLTSENR